MHAAKLEKSPRLQGILAFLRERGARGATGWEILEKFQVMNPGTEVSALRQNGIQVDCKQERVTETGRKVYRYTLVEERKQAGLFGETG